MNIFGETKDIVFTPSNEVGGTPTLNIRLINKKGEINKKIFLSLIDYQQHELNIEHTYVTIMYDNEAETWVKEF